MGSAGWPPACHRRMALRPASAAAVPFGARSRAGRTSFGTGRSRCAASGAAIGGIGGRLRGG
eukprot:4897414-Prymnesium_polylepis.1